MPPEHFPSSPGAGTEGAEFATPPTTAEDQPIIDHVMSGTGSHEGEEEEEEKVVVACSLDSGKDKPSPATIVSFDNDPKPSSKMKASHGTKVDSKTTMAGQDSDDSSPSPTTNGTAVAPSPSKGLKDEKDLAELSRLISEISPELAQKALRDHWRTFLFKPNNKGERPQDHHLSFILRAAFKNAPHSAMEKIVRTAEIFRPELLKAASEKPSVVDVTLATVTASKIMAKVPEETIEEVISERLKHMPARKIVNILAKANRLGYAEDDIIDEDESVYPNQSFHDDDADMTDHDPSAFGRAPPQGNFSHHRLALPDTDPLLAEQERNAAELRNNPVQKTKKPPKAPRPLKGGSFLPPAAPRPTGPTRCPYCLEDIPLFSGYLHHIQKRVCDKVPPTEGWRWKCHICIQGFTTKQGRDYHLTKKVCQGDDIAPATTPSRHLHDEDVPAATAPLKSSTTQQKRPRLSISDQPKQSLSQLQLRVELPKSPLRTPASRMSAQEPEKRLYLSPSELPQNKFEEMNQLLAEQEVKYQAQLASVPTDEYPTPDLMAKRLASLKASNATRCSQIRKSFGVTLRMREKDKKSLASQSSTPTVVRPSLEGFRRSSVANGTPRTTDTPTHSSSPFSSSFSSINDPQSGARKIYQASMKPTSEPSKHDAPARNISSAGIPMHNPPYSRPSSTNSSAYNPTTGQPNRFNGLHTQNSSPFPRQSHPSKRQRTSDEGTYSPKPNNSPYFQQPPASQPGLNMLEVGAEDAATRIQKDKKKKVPIGQAQAKWESLRPSFDSVRPGSQALKPAESNGIITISSSDDESDLEADPSKPPMSTAAVISPDQPLRSVETADDNS